MRFRYDAVNWRFIARILNRNSRLLSRTRGGRSDTSCSKLKLPLLFSGEELRRRSALNERDVHRFIFATREESPPAEGTDVLTLLWAIANLTNRELLPPGVGRLRGWPMASDHLVFGDGPGGGAVFKIPPEELPTALDQFADTIHERWQELDKDPVPLASWAEWELNRGSLHPFYDGCGRISRSFAALLLVRSSWLLPRYDSLASYVEQGRRGQKYFAEYVRGRIEDCARWVNGQQFMPAAQEGE
jgi:Fic family protein